MYNDQHRERFDIWHSVEVSASKQVWFLVESLVSPQHLKSKMDATFAEVNVDTHITTSKQILALAITNDADAAN